MVVGVCSLPSINGVAAEQKPATTPEPAAPAPPAVIPLANIAARATEVSNLLSSLTAAAVPGAQIESIAKALPDLSESVIR